MPVLASELVKRKKEHVFAEGYEIDVATELTGSVAATEEVIHIYGQDNPILDITNDNATLTITVYDKKENNSLLEVLQRLDPAGTANWKYDWANVYETSIWANRFNATNTQYSRSIMYKHWLPVPGMTAGDASAKGMRTFAGNATIPKEYNQPILGEKLAITTGASGTSWTAQVVKAAPPVAVPALTVEPGVTPITLYAVRVMAINEERSGTALSKFDLEELEITAGMVSSSGAIAINGAATPTGDLNKLTWATHVYVNYLYDKGLGVHPNIKPNGLYENIT